jgi:hypothetical protein
VLAVKNQPQAAKNYLPTCVWQAGKVRKEILDL